MLDMIKINDLDITIRTNFNNWLGLWQTSFRSSIGDFDEQGQMKYLSQVDWLIFFISSFFLIILMLNLLISVIAAAQTNYTDSKVQ